MAWIDGGAQRGASAGRSGSKLAALTATIVLVGTIAVGVGNVPAAHVADAYVGTWFPAERWVNPFADPVYHEAHCVGGVSLDVYSYPHSAPEPGGQIRAMADGQVVLANPLVIVHQTTTGPLDAVYRGVTTALTVGTSVQGGDPIGTDPNGDGALGLWKVPAGSNPTDIVPAPPDNGCTVPAGWIFLPALAALQPADLDVDHDGVGNAVDRCAGVAGQATWDGCGSNLLRNGSFERGSAVAWETPTTGSTHASPTWSPSSAALSTHQMATSTAATTRPAPTRPPRRCSRCRSCRRTASRTTPRSGCVRRPPPRSR